MEEQDARRVASMLDALDGFEKVTRSLHHADWHRPTGCPGWSVKDVVSHVVGLEAVLLGEPEPDIDLPDHLPHVTGELGRYMEMHVEARRDVRIDDLLAEMGDVFERRRRQLATLVDLDGELPQAMGTTSPARGFLGIRTFDIYAHEQDVRRAVEDSGHLDGPAGEVSLRRIQRALVRNLPKRVGPLDATVVIEITGEQAATIAVDLATGEAPAADVTPTVHITMPFACLLPLACGRDDAPDPGAAATITGDAKLAALILTSLAVTP